MKILLINPPYNRLMGFKTEWFPLGLAYLASFSAAAGFKEIQIYDAEHGSDTQYLSLVKFAQNFANYKKALKVEVGGHPVWEEIRQTILNFQPGVVGISVITPKFHSAFRKSNKFYSFGILFICPFFNRA